MKHLRISVLVLLVTAFSACKKSTADGGGGNTDTDIAPTNLTVSANIAADNTGSVTFTAGATNAATFEYDFGNGTYQTVPSGIVTYRYPQAGTYSVNVIAKSMGGKLISKSISVTIAVTSAITWSDEFNVDGPPDATKWGYDTGAGGWGNNEVQYYTNRTDNAVVSNGTLKITAKKENFSGAMYTSARLISAGKFTYKYGKIEIRAKLPTQAGTWPAIWSLGSNFANVGWPACGEIDIMEQTGWDKNKVSGTFHYPGFSAGNGPTKSTTVSTSTTAFHTYGLEWDATSLKISVDGVVYQTLANDSGKPFNANFFMILNVAMGGTLGGTIDPNFTTGVMEVDYVRYYQ
ncbi:family 16 glycosylhydrolase [Mucilaginibacter myungsuensis]|uniref:Family 16 glycosylhydrolase n=1 Tax=Mucilaginibacter myungsuensis TaxID=649104 RepID=A0A929PYT1_9SPHI|nr:family 16 glycosylhydrolase [Mucilaginibacter myungsuensis]MBE9664596.1 family 16 glycosylhydrolase [Mucilaginibacter myungsuensis]MDN3601054.1 family 16 glycosylhydrolase [Mucilaginibacter myungsuensis]